MMEGIEIIHEPNAAEPFLVLNKASGLPSAPIKNSPDSAFTRALELYPELEKVSGRKIEEHGLVHRIDTATSGLLLIAANQDFYEWILKCQEQGRFIKSYTAFCQELSIEDDSFPPLHDDVHEDLIQKGLAMVSSKFRYFGKDRKLVRPVCPWSSPAAIKKAEKYEYSTELRLIEKKGAQFKFEASISRGFKHQVRCHLCWCGFPILGDADYNPHAEGPMQFYATGFHFPMPDGREAVFSIKG